MNVLIGINYISAGNKVSQAGSFPLRGKSKEQVALEWWKKIRNSMPFGGELEKVTVDGEDLTEQVIKLEKAPLD